MPLQSQLTNTPPTSRLPDYHVLGSLTDVKPGTIPLLVRMPDGNHEQLDVPLHSTVDDIASSLQKDSSDAFRLSFGNTDLDPDTNLLDTNIVDAYEHAGSLLHLIATGRQDTDTKAAALDSACAVVESISNGIKDMEALCAAAMPDTADQPDQPHSPGPNREPNSSDPTPSQLAYNLSRRLPNLFPPSGTAAAFPHDDTEQPTLGRQVTAQPSLSNIRDARRRYSALRKAQADDPQSKLSTRVPDIAIGESTNVPLPLDLEHPSQTHDREPSTSLMLANSGKTTWLEDVMKTWEVDAVRDSGILEKSKDGQELSTYLQSLEHDSERDIQIEKIDNYHQPTPPSASSAPGDSSDEDDAIPQQQGHTNDKQTIPNGQPTPPNGHPPNTSDHTTDQLEKSIAAVNISDQSPSHAATQMLAAQHAASAAVTQGSTTPSHQEPKEQPLYAQQTRGPQQQARTIPSQAQQTTPHRPKLQIPVQSNSQAPIKPSTSSRSSSSSTTYKTENLPSSSNDLKTKPPVRQATKIAPAPNLATSPLAGANSVFPNPVYPAAVPVPSVAWPPKPTVPAKKKRGRKRKNPELTDEERALARKEQNRESAKLSRVRRKVIAAEYEGKLTALIDENSMLRKQVEGLNNRLVYLQSLLTVSVRPQPS